MRNPYSNDNHHEEVHMLEKGMTAPAFSVPDADGTVWTNEDFKGKLLVLYFYPKDNTAG